MLFASNKPLSVRESWGRVCTKTHRENCRSSTGNLHPSQYMDSIKLQLDNRQATAKLEPGTPNRMRYKSLHRYRRSRILLDTSMTIYYIDIDLNWASALLSYCNLLCKLIYNILWNIRLIAKVSTSSMSINHLHVWAIPHCRMLSWNTSQPPYFWTVEDALIWGSRPFKAVQLKWKTTPLRLSAYVVTW